MKHIHKLATGVLCVTLLTLSSCCKGFLQDWLDVQPRQNIKASVLFDEPDGYRSALIGCYDLLQLNSELYTGGLNYDFISKLEQRYDNNRKDEVSSKQLATLYDYKNQGVTRNKIDAIWSQSYNTLVNVNNLIFYLNKQGKSVLTDKDYYDISAQAYGLRGLLYFNLLRLWGPVYSQDPEYPTAPYRTEPNNDKLPLAKASELAQDILKDLNKADSCYMASSNGEDLQPLDEDMHFRMNVYAVKALKAEVYQWIGDDANALKYANEVIDHSGLKLVTNNLEDPVFLGETIFGVYVYNFYKTTKSIFPINTSDLDNQNSSAYFSYTDNIQEVYEVFSMGNSDIRYKYKEGFINDGDKYVLRKFMNLPDLTGNKDVVPIIRLSNMYLIKAESGSDADFVSSINTLWKSRGIRSQYFLTSVDQLPEESRLDLLNKEYAKEYFGEGIWWYFLKRHNMTTFYRAPEDEDMSQHYIFPIPEDEKEHGLGNRDEK